MPVSHSRRRVVALAATAAAALAIPFLAAPAANADVVSAPISYSADDATLSLTPLGSYETGVFDKSAAEIVHFYDDRLYVVNALAGVVDVLDASDPSAPTKLYSIQGTGVANSVAIRKDGLGVVALEAEDKTAPGSLLFFDANADAATVLGEVTVGALPDNVVITDNGRYAVSANEGEPADDFSSDPEGSIGVVTLPGKVAAPTQKDVKIADFHAFEEGGSKTLDPAVRVFGPEPESDYPVSRNLEPEFIALDGTTAYAALQEANAIAVIDLKKAEVTEILPLGYKDLSVEGNGIDASDRDPKDAPTFNISTYEGLYGVYMPDGIESYKTQGSTYLVTANEGDAREWGDYSEVVRVKDLKKESYGPVCADSPLASKTGDADLGRLNVTKELGFDEAAGCYSSLYAFGGRSFSIWNTDGTLVFDSGDALERITHEAAPEYFNSNHSESNLEGRSDDKGPEPENLAIGTIGKRTYAFIGLERVGGIAVFDITEPASSTFVTYVNNRDFSVSVETELPDYDATSADDRAVLSKAGDLGPEGVEFISAKASPTGTPLVAVGNEVSGTTTIFEASALTVDKVKPTATLVTPSTSDPVRSLKIRVDATDNVGLNKVVANIYQDGKLVKSTQTAANGKKKAKHTATVSLPDGAYTIKYNASDLAGNISQTGSFAVTVDAVAPTVTVKTDAASTLPSTTVGAYAKVSFKLYDAGKVDKIVLNGVEKDLSNNAWSDLNFVTPGVFGAVAGKNTLVIQDVAGNKTKVEFTLS